MLRYAIGVIVFVLLALLFWLVKVMPEQAWAVWDGENYKIVAEGWGTLLRAWPVALLGVLAGLFVVATGLVRGLEIVKEQDYINTIKQLQLERDSAVATAEQRVKRREAEANEREQKALVAQQQAAATIAQAKAAQEQAAASVGYARQEVERAKYRTKNAVAAANRIKQKLNS